MDNNDKITTISNQLINDIDKISLALDSFKNDLDKIQTGIDNKPFWNGKNAYEAIESCLAQYDYNCKLLEEIKKCNNYLESLKN